MASTQAAEGPRAGSPSAASAASAGVPPPGVYAGVFRNPDSNPFTAERQMTTRPLATRSPFPSGEDDGAGPRDLFASRTAPRPSRSFSMSSFSMSRPAPRDNGFSPPLGSVFSTRKSAPVPAPEVPDSGPSSSGLPTDAQLALAAFDRGLELVARKDHEHALEAWVEAVMLDPGNRTFQANLNRLERLLASAAIE